MFHRATVLLVLLLVGVLRGQVLGDDTAVPATALIPDDAILVVRVTQPKALIERALTSASCSSSSHCLCTRKPWPRGKRSRS